MPSQTRGTLRSLVNLLVGDPSQQRFTAAQVQAKLEEAQERFVLDTRVLRDAISDTSVAGTAEYNLPSDVLNIVWMAHKGLKLTRISKADLFFYKSADRWDDDSGTPRYYYVNLDPNDQQYGLFPIPTAADAGANISGEYLKMPPVLSSDSSVPFDGHTLLIPYHNALAYFAAKELLIINPTQEGLVKVDAYKKRYSDEVSHCIETFKHMEQSQGWRLVGGRYHKGL